MLSVRLRSPIGLRPVWMRYWAYFGDCAIQPSTPPRTVSNKNIRPSATKNVVVIILSPPTGPNCNEFPGGPVSAMMPARRPLLVEADRKTGERHDIGNRTGGAD